MLRSSIAIVIGPTPPGTGVIRPATLDRRLEVHIADEPVVGAVDADVDHGRAGLDPVAPDHLGTADGGDQHVGPTADLGQIAGARMADRDRRVLGQQQRRDRLADEVGAADDDRLGAAQWNLVAAKQLDHAGRSARPQSQVSPFASRPAETGVRPSTSLAGSISVVRYEPSM